MLAVLALRKRVESLPVRERGLKFITENHAWAVNVAPRSGAWIEIKNGQYVIRPSFVAPRSGAWIEMGEASTVVCQFGSLPVRERGLKCLNNHRTLGRSVAPRSGAWIEMYRDNPPRESQSVAPRSGAWIEIFAVQRQNW